jgi:hypothetical protein
MEQNRQRIGRSVTSFGLAYSDGRLIVDPPRLNGLRIKQKSFRKLMEPFVWSYILEKDLDEEDDSFSLCRPLVVSSRRLVVASSPLGAPSSCPLVVLSLPTSLAAPATMAVIVISTVSFGSILANISWAIYILVDASLYVFGRWWIVQYRRPGLPPWRAKQDLSSKQANRGCARSRLCIKLYSRYLVRLYSTHSSNFSHLN